MWVLPGVSAAGAGIPPRALFPAVCSPSLRGETGKAKPDPEHSIPPPHPAPQPLFSSTPLTVLLPLPGTCLSRGDGANRQGQQAWCTDKSVVCLSSCQEPQSPSVASVASSCPRAPALCPASCAGFGADGQTAGALPAAAAGAWQN